MRTFRKLLWRCFLACGLTVAAVFFTVSCCIALACSTPGFYSAALADPIGDAEITVVDEELGVTMGALKLYMLAGPEHLDRVLDAPPDQLARGLGGSIEERLPAVLDRLKRSADIEQGTFAVSLSERQANAIFVKEFGSSTKEVRHTRLAFDGDLVRLAATVVTPLTELVISCDFKPTKSEGATIDFELHAMRLGRLPMPSAYLVELFMRTNPKLPKGARLELDGDYPTLTIDATHRNAGLLVDRLSVADGELRLKFKRAVDAIVAAK